ncbi:hypothetical protein KFU94_50450 [Chloroflexi bacterium TSY]|nr:hypothetical protein [Chloroflexi bacterium TSY]
MELRVLVSTLIALIAGWMVLHMCHLTIAEKAVLMLGADAIIIGCSMIGRGQNRATIAKNRGEKPDMNRYFLQCQMSLNRLLQQEEVLCNLVSTQRGPIVNTFLLRLKNPTSRNLKKVLNLGPSLAQMLRVESVRVFDTAQGITIEIPSQKPVTPNGIALARYCKDLNVAVDADTFGKPVSVSLEDHGALFWVGPSRRGKTQSMKSTLYSLVRANAEYIQFVIFAPKFKDWQAFENVVGCLGIVRRPDEVQVAFDWIIAQMNDSYGEERTVIVVDDLINLLKPRSRISPCCDASSSSSQPSAPSRPRPRRASRGSGCPSTASTLGSRSIRLTSICTRATSGCCRRDIG